MKNQENIAQQNEQKKPLVTKEIYEWLNKEFKVGILQEVSELLENTDRQPK